MLKSFVFVLLKNVDSSATIDNFQFFMAAILDFKITIFSSTNKYFLVKYDITSVKLHFVSFLFFMKYTIPHS